MPIRWPILENRNYSYEQKEWQTFLLPFVSSSLLPFRGSCTFLLFYDENHLLPTGGWTDSSPLSLLSYPPVSTTFLPYPPVSTTFLSYPPVSTTLLTYPPVSTTFLPYPPVSTIFLPYPPVSTTFLPYPPVSTTFLPYPPVLTTFLPYPPVSTTFLPLTSVAERRSQQEIHFAFRVLKSQQDIQVTVLRSVKILLTPFYETQQTNSSLLEFFKAISGVIRLSYRTQIF